MDHSLTGHLNHPLTEYVAEVLSPWLDDEVILPFLRSLKDWQEKVALPGLKPPKFALYSTGWSVDKVSLILMALVSSTGVVISKISEPISLLGTAWKKAFCNLNNFYGLSNILESIPGFQIYLEPEEIKSQLSRVGAGIFSPPEQLESFFKKIPSPEGASSGPDIHDSFLTSFISSLLLCGVNGASFDIKVGEGSALKNPQEARTLALSLKNACDRSKVNASFILSDLNQPLGQAVGSSLEVREVMEVLKGKGPLDVLKLSLELGTEILLLAKKSSNRAEVKKDLKEKIINGEALEKLKEIIEAQGGKSRIIDDYSLLPQAKNMKKILSEKKGFIHGIRMRQLHSLCFELETTGKRPNATIDHGNGILLYKKYGEKVEKGEPLAEVHFNQQKKISRFEKESQRTFMVSEKPPYFRPFIYERIATEV